MRYLFDTDACIELIRRRSEPLLRKLDALQPGEVGISAITAAELAYGVARGQQPDRNQSALNKLLCALVVLPFDQEVTKVYGVVRASLEEQGIPIGPLDTLIAAHAKKAGLILVTRNVKEFRRVTGLRVKTW